MTIHQICVCNNTPCPNNIQLLPNQNLPCIEIYFGNQPLTALVDTGAQVPLLDESVCRLFSLREPPVKFTTKTVQAISCSGETLDIKGSVIGRLKFHQFDEPSLFAEFFLLERCSQQCIFPHTWLQALKVNLNYNTLSIQYHPPPNQGFLLSAEGNLVQTKLHKQAFWTKALDSTSPLDHAADDVCEGDHDDDDGDGDNEDGEAGDDDDGDGDGGVAAQKNGGDDDVAISFNAHLTHPLKCQCKCRCNSSIHLPVTIRPRATFSRSLNQVNLACMRKIHPGAFHLCDNLSIWVWNKPKDKLMVRLFNNGDQSITVRLCQISFHKPKFADKTLPVNLKRWTVNTLPVRCPDDSTALSTEAINRATQKIQSEYSTFSKSLDNLSLNSQKVSFSIPADMKSHPFNQKSSPLTILHVYLILIIGTNLKYMLKTHQELKEIITILGLPIHHRTLTYVEKLFKKGQIQRMYSSLSLYITGLIHLGFLDHQRRQSALQSKEVQLGASASIRVHQQSLLANIKATSALFFLNQKLINQFFECTLQHPYYQQLKLPLSFDHTLQNLGFGSDYEVFGEQGDNNKNEKSEETRKVINDQVLGEQSDNGEQSGPTVTAGAGDYHSGVSHRDESHRCDDKNLEQNYDFDNHDDDNHDHHDDDNGQNSDNDRLHIFSVQSGGNACSSQSDNLDDDDHDNHDDDNGHDGHDHHDDRDNRDDRDDRDDRDNRDDHDGLDDHDGHDDYDGHDGHDEHDGHDDIYI